MRSEHHLPGKKTGRHLPKPPFSGWGNVSSHAWIFDSWASTWAASHLGSTHLRWRPNLGSPRRSSSRTRTPQHPPSLSPPADGSLTHKYSRSETWKHKLPGKVVVELTCSSYNSCRFIVPHASCSPLSVIGNLVYLLQEGYNSNMMNIYIRYILGI